MSATEPLVPSASPAKSEDRADTQPEENTEEVSQEPKDTTMQLGTTEDVPTVVDPPLSKNAQKRLRRQQEWEEAKDERRERRKEKRHGQKARKKDSRAALVAQGVSLEALYPKRQTSTLVPVALILDCDFETYMMDKERVSLSSQITRSYSDNRNARYGTHLWIAGWKGKIKQRFTEVLEDQHKNWKGVGYVEGDFVEGAEKAREEMKEQGGEMIGSLQRSVDEKVSWTRDARDPFPMPDPEPEPAEEYKDIVYLSSDSPYTLERLEPNTSYIIGGLVDKNREKGLCYRRARERGIRTAKLPIGQFMVMASRQVLATNHVVEIMLKWLEYEDWGKAFVSVIPKRKGGRLRAEASTSEAGDEGEGGEEDGADEAEQEASVEAVSSESVTGSAAEKESATN